MKLPTAKFPAQLREMKLVNKKPLRRLFSQVGSAKADLEASKGMKLALNLLLVRPWVLVLGFWLLSMGVGALSLNGMLSPRRLRMALPEPTVAEPIAKENTRNSLLTVEQVGGDEQSAEESNNTVVVDGDAITTSAESGSEGSSFPLLPIVMLVGSCAAGSLLISRRRAAMGRMAAARAKGRVRKSRPAGSVAMHSAAPSMARTHVAPVKSSVRSAGARGRKGKAGKLSFQAASEKSSAVVRSLRPKKRRQRSKSSAMTTQASGRNRVLASRTNAQRTMKPAKKSAQPQDRRQARPKSRVARSQARRAASRSVARRQPIVSVVPANESHALDWPNNNLAHQMDVRQQRSAM